jgi:hypothetical protein
MGSAKSIGLWAAEATLTTRAGAELRSSGRSRRVSRKWERWLTAKVSSWPSPLSDDDARVVDENVESVVLR